MHEWALAEGVISTALRVAIEEGLEEITEIVVMVGELQQVDRDAFLFALEQLRTQAMRRARFTIEPIPARLRCRVCGEEWFFKREALDVDEAEAVHFLPEMAHVFIKCPICGSPDFEISEGRGVWLASVRGVRMVG
ncbi:MAG: hydrogenase nickel incorporation protein HypA [Candidatus Bathyarchaeia archaeon]|nr:hydrogenase nickel incorporation protein HypA [Candidatus Bathyarchaeota archaeon]